MDFGSINQMAASLAIATATTFGTLLPPSTVPSPTPVPLIKPIIHQEAILKSPEVTVEKFIGPTLSEIEKEVTVIKKEEKIDLPKEATPEAKTASTETKSPEPSPTATTNPTQSTPTPSGSQNFELIWQMVQNHRTKIGLPPFEKDERLCKIAEARGPQLQNEIFGSGTMHQGMKDMNLPYWNTENLVAYETEQKNFDWWMSDAIHRQAIESNNKYSCGTCFGNICVQEFSSFIPK